MLEDHVLVLREEGEDREEREEGGGVGGETPVTRLNITRSDLIHRGMGSPGRSVFGHPAHAQGGYGLLNRSTRPKLEP